MLLTHRLAHRNTKQGESVSSVECRAASFEQRLPRIKLSTVTNGLPAARSTGWGGYPRHPRIMILHGRHLHGLYFLTLRGTGRPIVREPLNPKKRNNLGFCPHEAKACTVRATAGHGRSRQVHGIKPRGKTWLRAHRHRPQRNPVVSDRSHHRASSYLIIPYHNSPCPIMLHHA